MGKCNNNNQFVTNDNDGTTTVNEFTLSHIVNKFLIGNHLDVL